MSGRNLDCEASADLTRDHASNAAMLHAVGISHVVSVGESLLKCPDNFDPSYGQVGSNQLAAEARAGRIQVYVPDSPIRRDWS